jgi:hypothetical protein
MPKKECPNPRYMNGQSWTVFGIYQLRGVGHLFARIGENRQLFAVAPTSMYQICFLIRY